jgi:hypothetical protein
MITVGDTALFGINAGQYDTTSLGFGLPPAKPVTPGGPVRMSGAISIPNRSTSP